MFYRKALPTWVPKTPIRQDPHLLIELGGFDLNKGGADSFQVTALVAESHASGPYSNRTGYFLFAWHPGARLPWAAGTDMHKEV